MDYLKELRIRKLGYQSIKRIETNVYELEYKEFNKVFDWFSELVDYNAENVHFCDSCGAVKSGKALHNGNQICKECK